MRQQSCVISGKKLFQQGSYPTYCGDVLPGRVPRSLVIHYCSAYSGESPDSNFDWLMQAVLFL